MNPRLAQLQPYPFERLNQLLAELKPNPELPLIALTVGEPQHTPPQFVLDRLNETEADFARYPSTAGIPGLRSSIADWLKRRFSINVDAEQQVLPCAGTREALFSFAQAVINQGESSALVGMPNPGYQIYEGASLLAGATPLFINPDSDGQLDYHSVSSADWDNCQLLYICSPANPTGAVLSLEQLVELIQLAEQHDFVIASDECYAEIYPQSGDAPPSLLQASLIAGNTGYERCMVFHSLSKRSNLPGLRSGFVAGDAKLIQQFLQYRTYHGATLPVPVQKASIAAWNDDEHVADNRQAYQQKYDAVLDILHPAIKTSQPPGSFYLWPELPIDETLFTQRLFSDYSVKVLPGSFLSRDTDTGNPGKNRIRLALTPNLKDCKIAAQRIRQLADSL